MRARPGCLLHLALPALKTGEPVLLFSEAPAFPARAFSLLPREFFQDASLLPVGTELLDGAGLPRLRVTGRAFLPSLEEKGGLALPCIFAQALAPVSAGEAGSPLALTPARHGPALAWITLSDKGSLGLREDTSGPRLAELAASALSFRHIQGHRLPDEPGRLAALLLDLAHHQGYELILTTGGTGLSPRDKTPEAVLPLLDRRLPGLEALMFQASLAQNPRAAVSRLVAGSLGSTLVLCLPGSRTAVEEILPAVLPAIPHALDKLRGDPADCGT